jgi:hypothetical protein
MMGFQWVPSARAKEFGHNSLKKRAHAQNREIRSAARRNQESIGHKRTQRSQRRKEHKLLSLGSLRSLRQKTLSGKENFSG